MLFAALTALACLTSLWKVNLPIATASGSTLSVSYAADLMALLLLGPQPAIIVAVAGVLTQCTYKVKKSYPLYRTLFSAAAEVLTMTATGIVYQQLGGSLASRCTSPVLAKPLVGAIATYFIVNTAWSQARFRDPAVARSSPSGATISSGARASFMVAGSAGAMAAVVVARGEHWKAILLVAPIYLTYRTYEVFVGRLEDQTRHMAEMRQVHEGTVKALAQAREAEHAEQAARAAARAREPLEGSSSSQSSRTSCGRRSIRFSDGPTCCAADDSTRRRRDRAFQSIYDSARRQAQLIDDLLDVSRSCRERFASNGPRWT